MKHFWKLDIKEKNMGKSFKKVVAVAAVSLAVAAGSASGQDFAGAVYAMSNDFDGNTIVAYGRNADGTLELTGTYPTGGSVSISMPARGWTR
jgi:hypothetical protein